MQTRHNSTHNHAHVTDPPTPPPNGCCHVHHFHTRVLCSDGIPFLLLMATKSIFFQPTASPCGNHARCICSHPAIAEDAILAPIQSFGAPDLRSYPTPSDELLSPQARKHRREKGHERLASIFYSEALWLKLVKRQLCTLACWRAQKKLPTAMALARAHTDPWLLPSIIHRAMTLVTSHLLENTTTTTPIPNLMSSSDFNYILFQAQIISGKNRYNRRVEKVTGG